MNGMTRDHISVKYKLDHICIFLPKVSCRGNHLRFTTVMLVNKNTVTHLFIFELKDHIQILYTALLNDTVKGNC